MESNEIKKGLKGVITPLSAAVSKYSRLSREKRNIAKLRFKEEIPNEKLDFSNLEHILLLIEFSNVYK